MNTPNALALAQSYFAHSDICQFRSLPRPPLTRYSPHRLHTHPPTRAAPAGRVFSVVGVLTLVLQNPTLFPNLEIARDRPPLTTQTQSHRAFITGPMPPKVKIKPRGDDDDDEMKQDGDYTGK